MCPAVHDPRERARESLLGIADLGAVGIEEVLTRAEEYARLLDEPRKKFDTLKGRSILLLFFENSTRTRTSFELAGKMMGADVVGFSLSTSSVQKGESLRDTVETATMMGFDALVVRHSSSGAPWRMQAWSNASLINAGDGAHEHPTQALLDALTVRQELGVSRFEGLHLGIVGDIAHSRVSRSTTKLFQMLGAKVTFVAPPTLLPPNLEGFSVDVSHDIDAVLGEFDIIYTIRPQQERIFEALIPNTTEYINRYSLFDWRMAAAREHAIILEAGPLLRGVQMPDAVADSDRNLMNRQVRNGVAVRMAVYERLIGGAA